VNEAIESIVVERLDSVGYDLVELKRGGTKTRPVFDVRIDRRDGEKVSVDDCAKASRAIEERLDADGSVVAERYVLEVSSPGAERPLKREQDWRRFVGRKANVSAESLHGRQEVEIVGVDGAGSDVVAVLRDGKGAEHRVPLAEVREARLAFNWKP
jgi:ribosome maturation factor RimP